jgi:hypothetical protein
VLGSTDNDVSPLPREVGTKATDDEAVVTATTVFL